MIGNRKRRYKREIVKVWVIALVISLSQGCVLLSSLSSKKLKPISTSELIQYMNKSRIDTTHAYYLTKSGLIGLISEDIHPTSIQIIDSIGQLYSIYTDTTVCQGQNEYFINESFDVMNLHLINNHRISSILESTTVNLKDQNTKSFASLLEKKRFTVLIYWGTFGLYNKRISDWQKAFSADSSLQIITINLDPNTKWW